jgi:hypothetical protein
MIQIWRRREKEVVGEGEDPDPLFIGCFGGGL